MAKLLASYPGLTDAVPVPTPTPTPTVHDVTIHDLEFNPSPLSVRMGDVVRWTNTDTQEGAQTVTSHAGSPQTFIGLLNAVAPGTPAQFQIPVTAMGNITYHCNIHPEMSGTIQVSM